MANTYKDPVCGLELISENVGATWDMDGEIYYFCSLDCKERFLEDPEEFILLGENEEEENWR
ncbi:MAG: YHS domain-containing protein [Chloroflexi bacterium]|nr:YHS domain-containing protein [Chloroflexota bacterium]